MRRTVFLLTKKQIRHIIVYYNERKGNEMIYEINASKREISIQIKTLIIDEESPDLVVEELERILA